VCWSRRPSRPNARRIATEARFVPLSARQAAEELRQLDEVIGS
jgi:hypothetical protein